MTILAPSPPPGPSKVILGRPWAEHGPVLLFVALLVLGANGITIAYRMAETSAGNGHSTVFWVSYGVVLLAALGLALQVRNNTGRIWALIAFGGATFLPKLLMTLYGPRYFDEYGHWRHANDIVAKGRLLVDTPYLPIQRFYPGLEGLTAVIHWVTRLGTWHAGQLIVVVAHCAVLVVIWQMAKMLDLPNRAAVVAAFIYSLNSSYLYFDTQYSYESLALPLCFAAVALAMGSRRAHTARGAWGLASLALLTSAGCVVTHHTSTVVMVALLVLVAAFLPGRPGARAPEAARWAPWAVAALAVAFAAAWLFIVAGPTYGYLEPHIRNGITDAANWLRGRSTRTVESGGTIETRRTLFSGSHLAAYEIVCAFLAPVIALGAVAATVVEHRRDRLGARHRLRLFAPFYALVALYLVSLPLTLTLTGGETAHRMWGFGYLGIAMVIASGDHLWDELIARFPPRRVMVAGAAALLVVAIGNTAAGENIYYRFPGPDVFGTDTRSRSAELDELAGWMRRRLPSEAKVITDRFTSEAVAGYTTLRVPEPADYLVYRLYREGGTPDPRLRAYLRDHDFRYFVLDRRIGRLSPVQRLFPGYVGKQSVSAPALRTVGTTPFLELVHSSPTYLVLRIHA